MAAEMTPGLPNGNTAVRIISHFVAPRASAPSLWVVGVCANTSRDSAVMIGRIMIASTKPARKMVVKLPTVVSLNSGNHPAFSRKKFWMLSVRGPKTRRPHRPKMIEGTAASRSTVDAAGFESHFGA